MQAVGIHLHIGRKPSTKLLIDRLRHQVLFLVPVKNRLWHVASSFLVQTPRSPFIRFDRNNAERGDFIAHTQRIFQLGCRVHSANRSRSSAICCCSISAFFYADRLYIRKAGVILAYRHPPVKKPPAKYPRQAAKSYHYTSVIHKPWRLQYA